MKLASSIPRTIARDEFGRMADVLLEARAIQQAYRDHIQTDKFSIEEIRSVGALLAQLETVLAHICSVANYRSPCVLPAGMVATLEAIEKDGYGYNIIDLVLSHRAGGFSGWSGDENSA